jgi:epsilon-lactone hydrolase
MTEWVVRRLRKWLVQLLLRFLRWRLEHVEVPGARAWARRMDALIGRVPAEVAITTAHLDTCDATWVELPGVDRERVLLYLHGGAFIMETPRIHTMLVAKLCRGTRARALMVAYRLAPEHKYPAAVDDCLAAYRHLLDSGCAANRIMIAGDSAGGNLAIVTLLAARDAGLPLPGGVVALSPLTDATFSGESMRRNDGVDPLFTRTAVDKLAPLYLPDGHAADPYLSPLFGKLDGLPPTLLMVGSSELLLDDSVRYAVCAREVTLEVWHDMPHVFPVFPMLAEANEAIARICAFLNARWAGGAPPR